MEMDLEKQPTVTVTSSRPDNVKRMSSLDTYQVLVGNVDTPVTPNDYSFYYEVVNRERSATQTFYLTAFLIYTMIAAQVILCLGITIGAQMGLSKDQISILAGVNTGVAATIGVLKGLGLPDKKSIERIALQKILARIRATTRRLKAGLEVDAEKEAEDVKGLYDSAEEAAVLKAAEVSTAASAGLAPVHTQYAK